MTASSNRHSDRAILSGVADTLRGKASFFCAGLGSPLSKWSRQFGSISQVPRAVHGNDILDFYAVYQMLVKDDKLRLRKSHKGSLAKP
jgi:hypothetical protein